MVVTCFEAATVSFLPHMLHLVLTGTWGPYCQKIVYLGAWNLIGLQLLEGLINWY